MNVAFKLLQHLGRDTPVAMEQCSTIDSSKRADNGVYKTENGYQALISIVDHSPRSIGSFTTADAASDAYELEYAKLQQQILRGPPRDNDQCDLPGYNHIQLHSQPPLYENKGEHHSDIAQCNSKRARTTEPLSKDTPMFEHAGKTINHQQFQARTELESELKWCGGKQYNDKGCNMKKDDSRMKASTPPTMHATVGIGRYEKPEGGAVTPPLNMFKNLVVTERIYSLCDNFSATTISRSDEEQINIWTFPASEEEDDII